MTNQTILRAQQNDLQSALRVLAPTEYPVSDYRLKVARVYSVMAAIRSMYLRQAQSCVITLLFVYPGTTAYQLLGASHLQLGSSISAYQSLQKLLVSRRLGLL